MTVAAETAVDALVGDLRSIRAPRGARARKGALVTGL